MKFPKVKDVAIINIICVNIDDILSTAIKALTDNNIRHLVVEDNKNKIYYCIHINDIVKFKIKAIPLDTPLYKLDMKKIQIIPKDYNVLEASTIFTRDNTILGILDENEKLSGILTESDVLRIVKNSGEDLYLKLPIKNFLPNEVAPHATKDDIVNESIEKINNSDNDCLIVVENKKPVGIITKRDIVKMLANNVDFNQPLKNVMSSPVYTFSHNTCIKEIIGIMQEKHFKRVIVKNDYNELIGIIDQHTLLNYIFNDVTKEDYISLDHMLKLLDSKVKEKTEELEKINFDLEARIESEVKKNREKDKLILEQKKIEIMADILNTIAHQWRQPLNVIALNIQEMEYLSYGCENSVQMESVVARTMSKLQSLSKTIDDFKSYFVHDENDENKQSIKHILEKVINLINSSLEEINIELHVSCNEDFVVYEFYKELKKVFLNILQNAKESFIANLNEKPQIFVNCFIENNFYNIEFSNNGGHIEESNLSKIFEPYFSTKDLNSRGIGLYMSKIVVEKHLKGKISILNVDKDIVKVKIKLPI